MIINWEKYVRLLLPPVLRGAAVSSFVWSLVRQVQFLASSFNLYKLATDQRITMGSVLDLQRIIELELDVKAEITELDGKPFDYLVSVFAPVDDNHLRAVVDRYNFGGKSYTLSLGSVAYEVAWQNYLCEDIIEQFTVQWSDYVCEDDGIVTVSASLFKESDGTWVAVINSSKNVASAIEVSVQVTAKDAGGYGVFLGSGTVNVAQNQNAGENEISLTEGNYTDYLVTILSIYPGSDDYYDYEPT